MSKQIVHMRLDSEIRSAVKDFSETEFDGNFTAAMEKLLDQSLRMRLLDDRIRWEMYGAAKRAISDVCMNERQYKDFIDTVADGLGL